MEEMEGVFLGPHVQAAAGEAVLARGGEEFGGAGDGDFADVGALLELPDRGGLKGAGQADSEEEAAEASAGTAADWHGAEAVGGGVEQQRDYGAAAMGIRLERHGRGSAAGPRPWPGSAGAGAAQAGGEAAAVAGWAGISGGPRGRGRGT